MDRTETQLYSWMGNTFGDVVINVAGHDVYLTKADLLKMLAMHLEIDVEIEDES